MPVVVTVKADGTATETWAEGIAIAIGQDTAARLIRESIPLSEDARAWLDVLESAIPAVEERAHDVAVKFGITPFDVIIAVGNRGSSDGFGWVPDHIGINVQAFVDAYGPPDGGSTERMVRIVAHEYLHLLTYAEYRNHRDLRQTPFDRALWTMFFEGIGDYVSVSRRWFPDEDGNYSAVTEETLRRLEPVLVDRLERLVNAEPETESTLRANISMGKFDQKWGSLPVALWLHSEVMRCGEEATLRRMLALERDGVLPLALRYADPALRPRIRKLMGQTGRPVTGWTPGSCVADLWR